MAQFSCGSELFYPRVNLVEAELASLDKQIAKSEETGIGSESLVRLEVFHPVVEGYRATESQTRYFASGSWKVLVIDLPGKERNLDRPLRIDPVSYPAVIDIAEIALKRPSTGEILWAATGSKEFAALTVGGTACRLAHESYLRILSFGNDPQLFLPQSTTALGDSPLRLELSILVDPSPQAISASLVEMQRKPRTEVLAPEAPRMVIFTDQGNGYSDEASLTAPLQMDVWQTIRFDHLEKFHTNPRARLRIDPIDRPAFLSLSSIRIIRDRDDFVLYSAESASDFEKIDVSSGILKHQEGDLFLVATDSDPQIYLPILDNLGTASYRLEITLEPQGATRRPTLRHRRALEERSQLAAKLETAQAQAKLNKEQIASLENELRSSQRAGKELQAASTQLSSQLETERAQNEEQVRNLEQQKKVAESELEETRRALLKSRDETARFSSQLETERAQNEEQVRNIEQQKKVAESELEETRRALVKSRDETARFSGVLEIRNSNSAGLALYNARLQSRPEVSGGLLAVGVASKHGDPEMSAVADSILEDIERIRRPSFLWRMAKAFGVLRFVEPGVPRTAADRRAIARELKAAVREICKTLSSATTAPNEAAIKITRLLELRRKTSEIVHSINLSTLLRLKSPIWKIVHSERRAAGSFSEVTPASALFDAAWYLGQYPEVAALECDPLTHYLRRGAHEGRDPNPVFNTAWYLANNPNVAATDLNPLQHYLEFGARAGRDPSPLFDSSWYLEQNPALGSDVNPLRHYLECGALEGRDPHPLFSTSWYLAQNPEVAGLNPLEHYVRWGCHHGRSPHPLFDCAWYLEQYPDVASAGVDPLQHYLEFGARAGRDPHPLFDSSWYLEQNPALGSDVNPLRHYLECGALEGRDPHPLFDSSWYMRQDPPLKAGEVNPLQHYVLQGADEGRSPHPFFDCAWYLGQYPDVAGLNPLAHYVRWGCHGRSPHPLFDCAWYLEQYPDVASAGVDPLQHYLEFGARAGRDPHPLFDSSWYLEQNPALGSDVNPLRHYLECGALEGRDPHPLFSTSWYLAQNPEVAGLNPLEHYVRWGCHHGRSPHPLFDCAWYLEQYPDVASAGVDPLQHYLEFGARAGRDPSPLFDSSWYLEQKPALGSDVNPLRHYLECGALQGRDPHPLFDTKWYLSQKPDLPKVGLTPLEHYVSYGAREGRSPDPEFDSQFYIKNHPESVIGNMTPLAHYLTVGWRLGHRPNPRFDPQFYLRTYPDVAAANIEPFTHFVLQGRTEGRKTTEETISFEAYRPAFDIPREPTVSADPSLVPTVKAIAFYLPQFHPIPENDRWWGEGFTEWNNVRAGRPNFPGHYQPHIPTGLGYYDLRETQVLQKQTELAKAYGIYGFCFYYYWFGGKVLLDLPIRRMLKSGKPDFPFCICWANENWTRRWDGLEDDVLIAQSHSPEDDVNFIRRVENVLLQKNYIRVRGKPLLLVYRPSLFPDSHETTERWRDYFRRKGHGELHLVMVRSFHDQTAPEVYGFDAAVQFPPHFPPATITSLIAGKDEKFKGTIYDYTELRRAALEQLITASSTGKTYAAVMPSWDNTARRGSHAVIWANSSPESYYEWLSATVEQVQKKEESDERLIFINAWNEWAEGCHLEPDEKYGHAWLNATVLALRPPPRPLPGTSLAEIHPEPPRTETIKVPALRDRLRLVISVLFYHREDLIERFLQSILQQILKAESRGDIECSLSLSFNYQPEAAVIAQIHQIIATASHLRADAVHILENGFNVGFGAGHNMVFDKFDSDIFLIMNSDVRVIGEDWLVKLVDRFRGSDAVIVGLSETASRLRQDGCGIPIKGPEEEFDFVDGSALAVRSDLARRFGLFSPSYDYFYFEDVDLCLRYRQMGLQIALLDAPYEHERSSSSRLLPQFAVENVLDRNRARLFEKWGKYLRTRTLSNRIGVRFLEIDRQLQCASLPALFGLLAEHGTAVIDLWGVHEQLGELFQHPRIRLIPSWQTLREDDYLRHYDLATNQAETPRVYDIANRMGCDPDFEGAKAHLESLVGSAYSENSKPTKTALLYVTRKSPLFDGKEPNVESFATVAKMLREKNFSVRFYTDYGTFETEALSGFGTADWKHAALCPGRELARGNSFR